MSAKFKSFIIERIYKANNILLNKFGVLILSINQQRKLGNKRVHRKPNIAITVDIKESIPPLAWICKAKDDLYHFAAGSKVEISKTMLVEGAWDGDFGKSRLEKSEHVFGSGAVFKKGKILFIPPKHCMEYLYVLHDKRDKASYVSNSLCYILESANIDLDGGFFRKLSSLLHETDNIATSRGVDRYDQIIVDDANYALYRMIFYNFSVDSRGNIQLYRLLPKKYFRDYRQYRRFLSRKISEIFENAKSAERLETHIPVTTITRGYDSSAVAVLARENGCDEALTLDVAVDDVYDSGLDIGRRLGFEVYSYKHVMSDNISDLKFAFQGEMKDVVLEFVATSGVGDDVTFYPFQDRLSNRVFMTGSSGDTVWAKGSSPEPGLPKRIIYLGSISEYRLRVGFFHLPVPVLGARFQAPIEKITNSAEMNVYSVGGSYDRPIPRRIVEEAGIPRSEFGVLKCATAPLVTNHKELFREAVEQVMTRYRL